MNQEEIRLDKQCVECGTILEPLFEVFHVGKMVLEFAGYWCERCQIGGIENPR